MTRTSSIRCRFLPRFETLEDRTLLATCTVTNLLDVGRGGISFGAGQVFGDLRFCINQANAMPGPDTIDFAVSGTINLTRRLPVLATDIVIAEGPNTVTVRRDTGGNYRVLTIADGVTVRVVGLAITNGYVDNQAGGGIWNAGNLTLIDVEVTNNTANQGNCTLTAPGGGIYTQGTAVLRDSTVSANKVTGSCQTRGGGIYNAANTSLTLEQTVVSNNRADHWGGGLYNASTLTLTGSNILSNTSYGDGGGIYNAAGASFTMTASSVSNNIATRLAPFGTSFHSGGGVYNWPNVVGVITDSSIANNRAEVTSGSQFSDAWVGGGGIYGGTLTIINSSITGNQATVDYLYEYPLASGGGIAEAELTISYSTVYGNTASANGHAGYTTGGGISGRFNRPVTISHSIITGNLARAFGDAESPGAIGGGVYAWGLTLTNSTISNNVQYGNHDLGYAGGVYATGAIITHSTIAGNTNGGLYVGGTIFTLRNSILANNTIRDIGGTIADSGYNLIKNPTGGSGYVPSDILNVDPMLGPLQDNGGATFTRALLPGSPAIDAGDNTDAPEFDQRGPGFPRIVNGTIDIGALEVQSTGAPNAPDFLTFLITADFEQDEMETIP